MDTNGDLLYTRRLPYEIYRFTSNGTRKGVVIAPFKSDATPDDAISMTESDGKLEIRETGKAIPKPVPALGLGGGWLLSGRLIDRVIYWDVFSPAGRLVASWRIPEAWGPVLGFDRRRNVLWLVGEVADEPVLLRISIAWEANRG